MALLFVAVKLGWLPVKRLESDHHPGGGKF